MGFCYSLTGYGNTILGSFFGLSLYYFGEV